MSKWSDNDIRSFIHKDIEAKEKLGHQAGGSGHLSFVSFELDDVASPIPTPEGWKVSYHYTLFIETEFTYYPDNPPYERKCTGSLILPE